jgi:hypothetical protein
LPSSFKNKTITTIRRKKMKNKNMLMVLIALVMSVVFINPSNAGECSLSDPCQTYAEVDSSGSVINTIVCQPSVCEQAWSGIHPGSGNKLVAQIAADANGNNRGGILANKNSGVEVKESNGTFTIIDDNPNTVTVVQNTSITTQTFSTNSSSTVETSISTLNASVSTSNGGSKTFNYEDTVNPKNGTVVDLSPAKFETTTAVIVTAQKNETVTTLSQNVSETSTIEIELEKTFESAVTEDSFENVMKDENVWDFSQLSLINLFFEFWLDSLMGWFLLS